ncbi:MAG: AraC family transcriptional regulator [Flavobacterium sp.]|nr:MAG: AraC family transcriptional regulator [Flavobacterium sp.]
MKISVVDGGSGVMFEFAEAIGANISGRFIYIPENKGGGYITGFNWGNLRMMIRNYHLNEEVIIERTNEFAEGQDDVVIMLSGVFTSASKTEEQLMREKANVIICKHAVTSVMDMPSNTIFESVTIAVSREYLRLLFGNVKHSVVETILESNDNFVFETGISADIIRAAGEIQNQAVPESFESYFYKLKCKELLCYIFTLLMQREQIPTSNMHIDDIKSIYNIKLRLESNLNESPNIKSMAIEAGMSEPKLRKLFKQTFGKGVFEYYQSLRMQEAAMLLKEKRLTVSEVGYQLGFTNLSHFSRVFEEHIGIKPKKYSMS